MEEQFKRCSARLKQCREENNLTLEDVAKKIQVNKSTILRWENGEVGKIKSPFLKELADLYKVNIVWLMGYDAEKNVTSSNTKSILDLSGLNDSDIDYLKKQIEYLRYKNKKSDKT